MIYFRSSILFISFHFSYSGVLDYGKKSRGVSMWVLRWSRDGSVLHGPGWATYDLLPFPISGLELNDCIY